ncbi:5-methyltetrahydropteroyltriglutamate--homocysteine methyltransferase [Archaeoglobus veneficus]|uniref:5-methyltetrahydropteroyltriglutamate--homocyste inemethyltransferase n=1 Tax=Archaeoglobus veneficus (strain DSM 11195 / SNP6) TaxID=693661 RepID=F2KQL8_ARCVS|nr:5-methyltetrahydropteroyltriglutamate--homocysteine methyltransferase [Archaeoglobus veneficus]AEA47751.1 5-methyltetrahydropteroyltriglutamate--homocyste inemethyltransferase [Archaeoglobus veneficus SNP6]
MRVVFDDIGSFPLPDGVTRDWVNENVDTKEYEELVQRTFLLKAKVVQCPNYPQFRDMVEQFMSIIRNPEYQEDAYLVSRKHAVIREVEAIKSMKYDGNIRICVTGPLELYYREFGPVIYDDLLENIAISVSRFAANAMNDLNVCSLSVDEPSLGINPELQPSIEQLKLAYGPFSFDVDVQIHLHSPLYYTQLLEVDEIDVFGVEAAKDEKVLDFVDAEEVASAGKRLRIGVARTDIDAILAEFNQRHGVNAWQNAELAVKAIDEIESVEVIKKRLEKVYDRFSDLLAYIGPDCGLFSFPNQECALKLLENVREALEGLGWTT